MTYLALEPDHPCFSHGCDGCGVCQAGGCCGQAGGRAADSAVPTQSTLTDEALADIRADAELVTSPLDLMRFDWASRVSGAPADRQVLLDGPATPMVPPPQSTAAEEDAEEDEVLALPLRSSAEDPPTMPKRHANPTRRGP